MSSSLSLLDLILRAGGHARGWACRRRRRAEQCPAGRGGHQQHGHWHWHGHGHGHLHDLLGGRGWGDETRAVKAHEARAVAEVVDLQAEWAAGGGVGRGAGGGGRPGAFGGARCHEAASLSALTIDNEYLGALGQVCSLDNSREWRCEFRSPPTRPTRGALTASLKQVSTRYYSCSSMVRCSDVIARQTLHDELAMTNFHSHSSCDQAQTPCIARPIHTPWCIRVGTHPGHTVGCVFVCPCLHQPIGHGSRFVYVLCTYRFMLSRCG